MSDTDAPADAGSTADDAADAAAAAPAGAEGASIAPQVGKNPGKGAATQNRIKATGCRVFTTFGRIQGCDLSDAQRQMFPEKMHNRCKLEGVTDGGSSKSGYQVLYDIFAELHGADESVYCGRQRLTVLADGEQVPSVEEQIQLQEEVCARCYPDPPHCRARCSAGGTFRC